MTPAAWKLTYRGGTVCTCGAKKFSGSASCKDCYQGLTEAKRDQLIADALESLQKPKSSRVLGDSDACWIFNLRTRGDQSGRTP